MKLKPNSKSIPSRHQHYGRGGRKRRRKSISRSRWNNGRRNEWKASSSRKGRKDSTNTDVQTHEALLYQGIQNASLSKKGRKDSTNTYSQTHEALLYHVVNISTEHAQTQYSTYSNLTPQMQYVFPSSTAQTSFASLLMATQEKEIPSLEVIDITTNYSQEQICWLLFFGCTSIT